MSALILYTIKASLYLAFFYVGYKTLLSNETFFRFNRSFLLIGMGVCMVLPLVEFRTAAPGLLQQPIEQLEELLTQKEGVTATVLVETPLSPHTFNQWGRFVWGLYLGGIAIHLARLLLLLGSLLFLIRTGRKIRVRQQEVIVVKQTVNPFNWGRYIVLSEEDMNGNLSEIVAHEQVHRARRHTIDLLAAEAVILLHWFNPAAWLLKKELRNVHEFEADHTTLLNGIDATKYQLLLVKKAVGSSSYTLANGFNHSKIKKRITMMKKKRSTRRAQLKCLLFVPAAACLLMAFSQPEVNHPFEQLDESSTISRHAQTALPKRDSITVTVSGKSDVDMTVTLCDEDDKTIIRQKLADIKTQSPTVVSIKATNNTKMGKITDIKEVIREICIRDSVYKVIYRVDSLKN